MPKEILLYEESIVPELVETTDVQDIATTATDLTNTATPVVSQTLPFMIGYVQPINAPQGFIFGLTSRDRTSISDPDYPASPDQPVSPALPQDSIITRSLVKTQERSVLISFTNEVEQDVMSLFDPRDSSVNYFGKDEKVSQFFLEYGNYKLNNKVNADFMSWLGTTATVKGSATIANYSEMNKILGVIGELKEALFRQTGKSGKTWIVVSPRIANYLSTVESFVNHNNSEWFNKGRTSPKTDINPYVGSFGDTDVYVYNGAHLAGGVTGTTETSGFIYVGLQGGPSSASVFYTPYKKYIVRSGDDSHTGHSVLWYKIRDAWTLNPQDTLDETMTGTDLTAANNNSKFIVSASITFNETLLS